MRSKSVLVVEDNPGDRKHIVRALKQLNLVIEIVVLEDGAEVLDYFLVAPVTSTSVETALPECIFLDLNLPNVAGLEILRQLRAQEQTRLIPIVIFTSSKEQSDLLASYELGANSYVWKPIDADEFTAAVQQTGSYWLQRNELPLEM